MGKEKEIFSVDSGEQLSTQRADLQENIHRTACSSPNQNFHTLLGVPSAEHYYVFYVHEIPVVSLSGVVSTCSKFVK